MQWLRPSPEAGPGGVKSVRTTRRVRPDIRRRRSPATSKQGASVIDALSYTYDSSGRRTSKTDAAGTTTYGYDTADRLISVLAPAGSNLPNETFAYDAAGNQTGAGQVYDAANRLLSDAKYTYTYDGEGNQTTRTERATGKVTTYTWNALHQLTSAHLPDGTVTYRYDALGRRVEQAGPSGATRYVNLGANVAAEYDGANTLRATYLTFLGQSGLPGMPLEVGVGSTVSYPLVDSVGSVTAFTDASGAKGAAFAYTAYGTPVGASSGTYAYGTYGYDSATGLYYARARYYDSGSGRFLSEDPVGLYASPSDSLIASAPSGATCATEACSRSFSAPTFPGASIDSLVSGVLPGSGLSPYGYGSQNPITRTDPMGRFPLDEYGGRTSSNVAANKVARDAGKAAARALGCKFTKAMRQALHREISDQGLAGFSEIFEVALELFKNCKGE